MKVLAMHEIQPWMLDLDLSEFDILTFDDGLYSQYRYYTNFLKYNKPMYFFISTGIICNDASQQTDDVISCNAAHKEFKKSGFAGSYMTWDQVKEIASTELCFIGGHSYLHHDLRDASIDVQYRIAQEEAIHMLNDFHEHGIDIHSFCYPYGHEAIGYKNILQKHGITKFFGQGRTKIEELK